MGERDLRATATSDAGIAVCGNAVCGGGVMRSGDLVIATIARDRLMEKPEEHFTTEARRHGEGCRKGNSLDLPIARDHPITRSHTIRRWIHKMWSLASAVLREI